MSNEIRTSEIISKITAFSNGTYGKEDYLSELFKLQQEIVGLTFNNDHAKNTNLKLRDVEKHLAELNEQRGNIADDEIKEFLRGNKTVSNTIVAEISGNRGERIVSQILETLKCPNRIIHNVELCFDSSRTEIDAILFTSKAIFILEVKNTKKDIIIDENGEFYRQGNSAKHECNIAQKMDERERLLRIALSKADIKQIKIEKYVVFTSTCHLDVENNCRSIKVCFAKTLPFLIERYKGSLLYNDEDICAMLKTIDEARCKEQYQMSVDMNEYKAKFAELMAKLEATDEMEDQQEDIPPEIEHKTDIPVAKDTSTVNRSKRSTKPKKKSYTNIINNGVFVSKACFHVFKAAVGIYECIKRG